MPPSLQRRSPKLQFNIMSTIVVEVDLECHRCYKKIRKAISKLQSRFNIQSTDFDEKTNTVTISGPFDADKACKKLCYNAGNIIKDIQIKGTEEEEEKPAEGSKPAEPKEEKAEDSKPASEPDEPREKKAVDAEPVAEPAYNGYYGYDWPPLGPSGQDEAVYGQPVYEGGYRYHSMFSDEDPQAACGIM